jgi:hypothetical protein
VSGVNCVLIPPGYDYDLPKTVIFDDNDRPLSKRRLIRLKRYQFWNPNRRPGSRQRRVGIGKCLAPIEGGFHKRSFRFASIPEAIRTKILGTIPAAYGLATRWCDMGEQSRNDLTLRWELEMAAFRARAQPIQQWATAGTTGVGSSGGEAEGNCDYHGSGGTNRNSRSSRRAPFLNTNSDIWSMGIVVHADPRPSSSISRKTGRTIVVRL